MHASTGRLDEADYLKRLGASEIIDRATLSAPGKPLQKERWAAAVDSVGSHTLANVCASLRYGGTVAACGLAQGMDFPSSVAPFILRGVTLAGVDSVMAPLATRVTAWDRLARELPMELLEANTQEIGCTTPSRRGAPAGGQVRGRVVVDLKDLSRGAAVDRVDLRRGLHRRRRQQREGQRAERQQCGDGAEHGRVRIDAVRRAQRWRHRPVSHCISATPRNIAIVNTAIARPVMRGRIGRAHVGVLQHHVARQQRR